MIKIVRSSTIGLSLNVLLKGQLRFLSGHFDIVGISSGDKDLDEVRMREGVDIYAINMERGISPLRDIVSLFKLYSFLKKTKPTIIHSITPKAGLLSMLAGKMARIPIRVHTFTGLIFPNKTGLMQKLLINMDRLLCWASTNIYPEGSGVKNDLINFKITSKPLKVIANGNVNGIDLTYFSKDQVTEEKQDKLRAELNISSSDFVFLFVGRLVGDKGINELVKGFLEVKNDYKKLLLVGPLESNLDPLSHHILHQIQNNPDIISVGFQKDVRPYFSISHALVFPSYREGFPNVVIQAGAMELPCIVSDINGCNEIVIEGENGTIIPVKNSEAIRNAMEKFMNDGSCYKKLKNRSREMIQSRYEQQEVWSALLEEYKTLLKERGLS